jgi:hypothetical protein
MPDTSPRYALTRRKYLEYPVGSRCRYWDEGGLLHLEFEDGVRAEVPLPRHLEEILQCVAPALPPIA